ncbi:helix-turn-helix domain-containing protein [Acididesulfobacillus acetoxydans]
METEEIVSTASLPPRIRQSQYQTDNSISVGVRLRQKMKEVEHQVLAEALEYFGTSSQDKEKVAKVLGVSRATMYRKLKEHNLV